MQTRNEKKRRRQQQREKLPKRYQKNQLMLGQSYIKIKKREMSENANTAVQANEDVNKKLLVLTKIGYSFGEIGSQCSWTLISAYLTVFYMDVVGLTPVAISAIMLIARIWDAINDPMFGTIAVTIPMILYFGGGSASSEKGYFMAALVFPVSGYALHPQRKSWGAAERRRVSEIP